ncbi:hypothetical protein CH365_19850 [Leptospira neocaledonica]|uniref:Nucleoside 2-deoxyribosyltransferase n=1 Tax=Leptospira neocaledonica TaxID=2023192 RepID=A0A2M9ZTM9_9LEPT|nr:hypothetical protein CH365_19850 [Leptospira neocaledonica]
MQPEYGEFIPTVHLHDCFAKNSSQMYFILGILKEKRYLYEDSRKLDTFAGITRGFRIEENGWIEIEKTESPFASKQAFVAFRIDNKEHNNEISGEILSEIRKSRFMIAEVTGQRPGVYFEAGYAMAFGLPVIWCCKDNELDKVHFDTRQYNHVVWRDETDLIEKLSNRIKGTIF